MAHIVTCDVCETQVSASEWAAEPGIEAVIPQRLMGDVGDPLEATFCSWNCVAAIATHYAKGEPEIEIADVEPELDEAAMAAAIREQAGVALAPETVAGMQPFQMPQVRIKG